MAELKRIATVDELPKSGRYVLVMPGDGQKTTRHSRGVTITVDQHTGEPADALKDMIYLNAVREAKQIADAEGIGVVHLIPLFPI